MNVLARIPTFALFLCVSMSASVCSAAEVSCIIRKPHLLTDAEEALQRKDFQNAAALYTATLSTHPDDVEAIAGLAEAQAGEEQLPAAALTIQNALKSHPGSAPLLTGQSAIQYRQGLPWEASKSIVQAIDADPCYPQGHLMMARIMRLNSMYAGVRAQVQVAHQLDPYDPRISRLWLETLPLDQRIAQLRNYISQSGIDQSSLENAKLELAILEAETSNGLKSHVCHLASDVNSAEIPFIPLMEDANRIRAWGLDVRFNGQSSRLEVDTGAGGLYVSRGVAQRAGLKPVGQDKMNGVGDRGPQSGYYAYADSIRIGGLEFRDCLVEVSDRRNVVDSDGLIGMDVFSSFLVTLDFPWRKMTLGPLPPLPDQPATVATLNTGAESPAAMNAVHGPHDRYIAPGMKSYTPVYRVGHDLLTPVSLNEKATHLFIVDTGAFRTVVSTSAAREVTKVHDSDMTVKGVAGRVNNVYSGDKVVVRFANLKQEIDDIVSFDNAGLNRDLGMEVGGFIGFDLLHYLTISIDYRDGLVKFDYSADRGYQHIR